MSKKFPQFCTITPTSYLPEYARYTGSKFHLLLAHLMHPASKFYDPDYLAFYRDTKLPGETYITDCGAFELGKSYDPDTLVDIGKSVGTDILVLPDYPGQSYEITINAAKDHIPQFKENGFRTFYVPQSAPGDWSGWMKSFEWALFNPDIAVIGQSILAHPIALPDYPKGYARVVAADRIRTWLDADPSRAAAFETKHIHWLGLLSPGLELDPLLKMGMVDTLDSSAPVHYGHCGIAYNTFHESWAIDKQYVPEVDFGAHINKRAKPIIEHNLTIIANKFKQYQTL
jgi:hypothetical protein